MVWPLQSHRAHLGKVSGSRNLTDLSGDRPLTQHRASEAAEFKDDVHFVKFDVDELPELSRELGVRAMPTFLFFKDGEKTDEIVGANPPALLQVMRKHIAPSARI